MSVNHQALTVIAASNEQVLSHVHYFAMFTQLRNRQFAGLRHANSVGHAHTHASCLASGHTSIMLVSFSLSCRTRSLNTYRCRQQALVCKLGSHNVLQQDKRTNLAFVRLSPYTSFVTHRTCSLSQSFSVLSSQMALLLIALLYKYPPVVCK